MITYSKQNILSIKAQAIVNTVNCEGVSGAGIAKEFKILYPENFIFYKNYTTRHKMLPGDYALYINDSFIIPNLIINLATKDKWENNSKIEWIEKGIFNLKLCIINLKLESIAIPPLGCGHGGLNWSNVKSLLDASLKDLDCNITIIEPF